MKPAPPRLARAVLSRLTHPVDREHVLADLDEAFERLASSHGAGAARRWYRAQALRSLPLGVALLGDAARGWASTELRPALRLLRRRPPYVLGIAGTLGLSLSSAIVLGGIAWRVWLKPLPFPDSEKLVRVYELGRPDPEGRRDRGRISPPLLRDLREAEGSHVSNLAGIVSSTPEWLVEGELRQIRGADVTPDFFELLGMVPLHGRTRWESRNGSEVAEVVLTERFWRQSFGSDPSVVGSSIDLRGVPTRIVGVVAQEGGYPRQVDVFLPLVFDATQLGESFRGARYMDVVARVSPGSTIEAASAEVAAFVESLGTDHPAHDGWTGEVVSLRDDLVGPFRDVLRLLVAAGATFLVLALVNMVGLASTRALEREQEIGIRLALGASTSRLARSAWVEGALLGTLGGAAALVGALMVFPSTIGWLPRDLARSGEVGLSWSGAAAWWIAALVLGGVVARLGQRVAPGGAGVGSGTRATRDGRAGRMLVAGQLALTTVLVGVGSIVFERSLALARTDFGFEAADVHSAFVSLPRSTHDDWEARRDSWGAIVSRLRAAGISAAITTNPPMSGMNSNYGYARPGKARESFGQYSVVSGGYFDVMGIPILAGRTFEPGESGPVTLVSEGLAREHFPGEDPIGRTLSIIDQPHTIIGVVGSTAHFGPDAPEPAAMYVSYEATNWDFAHVVVRGDPSAAAQVVEVVEDVAPGTNRPSVVPYEEHLAEWFRPLRIQLGVIGGLGLIGGVLAGLGLYATLGYQVRRELPELGIRVALGAPRARIVADVVRRGLTAAASGLALGIGVWWLGRVRLGEILGSPDTVLSPFALGTTTGLILLLCLVAVSSPAVRASRADPLRSLKAD